MREGGKYVSMEEDDPCPPPTMRDVDARRTMRRCVEVDVNDEDGASMTTPSTVANGEWHAKDDDGCGRSDSSSSRRRRSGGGGDGDGNTVVVIGEGRRGRGRRRRRRRGRRRVGRGERA